MLEIGRLRAATQDVDPAIDLLALAAGATGVPLFYWEHPAGGRSILGLGIVREIRARGTERHRMASAAALRMLAAVACGDAEREQLRVVGGFAFADHAAPGATPSDFPPTRFVLPRLLWVRAAGHVRLTEIWDDGDFATTAGLRARVAGSAVRPQDEVRLRAAAVTAEEREQWRRRVDDARTRIASGELRKVVLARRRHLEAEGVVDATTIVARARATRPSCFTVWMRGRGPTSFVASTPELLVRRAGSAVVASALAGSAPRSSAADEDRHLGAALLVCSKNGREHALVVAAVRSALGAVADDVTAARVPELLCLPEVQHLATMVSGRLRAPTSVLEVGGVLHPTPAVCGTPLERARALIERDEPERGWYAGALGWMDARGDGELVVALRSALIAGSRVTLWAGAGIVAGSDADAELAETEAKMGALVTPFLHSSSPSVRTSEGASAPVGP